MYIMLNQVDRGDGGLRKYFGIVVLDIASSIPTFCCRTGQLCTK
jgi:hypothetical protein